MADEWFETVAVAQQRAKRRLPKSVYSSLISASEKGITVSDNVEAFSELGFAPHVIGALEKRDTGPGAGPPGYIRVRPDRRNKRDEIFYNGRRYMHFSHDLLYSCYFFEVGYLFNIILIDDIDRADYLLLIFHRGVFTGYHQQKSVQLYISQDICSFCSGRYLGGNHHERFF